MIMLKLAESHLLSIEPYIPGRAIENDKIIPAWAKLASNENCLGPSVAAMEAARNSLSHSHLYPNAKRAEVIHKICEHLRDFSVHSNQVALGNGTSELIVNLARGLLAPNEAMLYGWPSFIMYKLAAKTNGRRALAIPLRPDLSYDLSSMAQKANDRSNLVKLIILANPNNPCGTYTKKHEFDAFVKELPKDVVLVIDEAYFEYVVKEDYPNGLIYALSRPRTVVLRTFSKVYGLAGLRLGYAVGDVNIIDILCRIRDAFNVNSVVQSAAIAALEDKDHVTRSVRHNLLHMPILSKGLSDLGFIVKDGVGNFLLAKKASFMPKISDLCEKLLAAGVIIRPLESYGLNEYVRISVGLKKEIDQLFDGLNMVLSEYKH